MKIKKSIPVVTSWIQELSSSYAFNVSNILFSMERRRTTTAYGIDLECEIWSNDRRLSQTLVVGRIKPKTIAVAVNIRHSVLPTTDARRIRHKPLDSARFFQEIACLIRCR